MKVEPPPQAGLPILTYHTFDTSGAITSTDPSRFVDTMARLVAEGFRCVSLLDWTRQGRPALEKAFALAFDDGDASILRVIDAFPTLGLTATLFVVTDHVGGANDWLGQPRWVPRSTLLDWSDLDALVKQGLTVGSHTKSHPDLTRLDRRTLASELADSRRMIEDRLGVACDSLVYPYGRENAKVCRIGAETYQYAYGTRLATAASDDPPHELPRVDAYYLRSGRLIERLIAGDAERWLRWRNRLRTAKAVSPWGRIR